MLIQPKTLEQNYVDGLLCIEATLEVDDASSPAELECYSAADVALWEDGEWDFVGVRVTVTWNGVAIAEDALYGIESGTLAEVECDPFTNFEVVDTALGNAESWFDILASDSSAHEAIRRVRVHFGLLRGPEATP